jgi:hypothetical protein
MTSCTTNSLSNQFIHITLCVYVSSIILLSSLLCISNYQNNVSSEPKYVSRNVNIRYMDFQKITKMSLHCDTLQDALKCLYTPCDTLFLRHIPKCHKNMLL